MDADTLMNLTQDWAYVGNLEEKRDQMSTNWTWTNLRFVTWRSFSLPS